MRKNIKVFISSEHAVAMIAKVKSKIVITIAIIPTVGNFANIYQSNKEEDAFK